MGILPGVVAITPVAALPLSDSTAETKRDRFLELCIEAVQYQTQAGEISHVLVVNGPDNKRVMENFFRKPTLAVACILLTGVASFWAPPRHAT